MTADVYDATKDFFQIHYFEHSELFMKNPEIYRFPQKCEATQLFSTLIIIINVFEQQTRMISEDNVTLKTRE